MDHHESVFLESLNTKFGAPGLTSNYTRYYICSLCRTKLSQDTKDGGCQFCEKCNKFLCTPCSKNQSCDRSNIREEEVEIPCSKETMKYHKSSFEQWGTPPPGSDQWVCSNCSAVLYRERDNIDNEAYQCEACSGVFCKPCGLKHV